MVTMLSGVRAKKSLLVSKHSSETMLPSASAWGDDCGLSSQSLGDLHVVVETQPNFVQVTYMYLSGWEEGKYPAFAMAVTSPLSAISLRLACLWGQQHWRQR